MRIILAVHMSANGRSRLYGEGFNSTDNMPGPVEAALKEVGIKYREPFTCIAIYSADEDPHDSRLPAWCWGPPVILKSEVLAKLEVACAGDIQNGASGRDIEKISRTFRNLLYVPNKEGALLELLTMRPERSWTEARMFDLLRGEDVAEDRYKNDIAGGDILFT